MTCALSPLPIPFVVREQIGSGDNDVGLVGTLHTKRVGVSKPYLVGTERVGEWVSGREAVNFPQRGNTELLTPWGKKRAHILAPPRALAVLLLSSTVGCGREGGGVVGMHRNLRGT
eukprot:gene18757-biopygen20471